MHYIGINHDTNLDNLDILLQKYGIKRTGKSVEWFDMVSMKMRLSIEVEEIDGTVVR